MDNTNKTAYVTKYVDNPNGTTTNYLSDGSTDTGTYSKNADGSLNFNPVYSPESLSPVTPVKVPQPNYSDPSAHITSTAETLLQKMAADAEQQKQTATAKADSSKQDFTDLVNQYVGVQSSVPDIQKQYGIDTKTQKVTDVTNQLEASQRAQQNEIKQLQAMGLTDVQMEQKQREINRKYAAEQADLSIIQSAANRDLLTAQTLADKKVELALAPLKTKLDYAKQFYNENKETLDKADQRAFQAKITATEKMYQEETIKQKALQDAKISLLKSAAEQGAPSIVMSAIQRAVTPEEAISVAGRYGGNIQDQILKKLQLQKTNLEIAKLNKEIRTIPEVTNPAVAKYQGAVGVILGSAKFTKEQKAAFTSAINNSADPTPIIKNQAKELMSGSTKTKLEGYENTGQAMSDIQSVLSQYYANGGKTDLFSGNFETVTNKLGEVSDPRLVQIAVQIQTALQAYRNAVSGTAYSVQEGKDINSIFPGINKSEGLNNAIIAGRKQAFDSQIDGLYRGVLGKTYDDVKSSPASSGVLISPDGKSQVNAAELTPEQIQEAKAAGWK